MKLNFIEPAPNSDFLVSFGVPWKRGELLTPPDLSLKSGEQIINTNSFGTAYWPDGSVKWSGHRAVITLATSKNELLLVKEINQEKSNFIVDENFDSIKIDTGTMKFSIKKNSSYIFDEIKVGSNTIANNAKLIFLCNQIDYKENVKTTKQINHVPIIKNVMIESQSHVNVVIKIQGTYDQSEKFPFCVRLYLFENLNQIKIVNTFFYGGDSSKDFVAGIGIRFNALLKGLDYNRHIRFSTGDEGKVYNEPAKLLFSRRFRESQAYTKQINGEIITFGEISGEVSEKKGNETWNADATIHGNAEGNAIWNDYKFSQLSSSFVSVKKRTTFGCSYIDVIKSQKLSGFVYAGGENGGVAISIKDFSNKAPSGFQVNGLSQDATSMTMWFYSPDGEHMDMQHYSQTYHVKSAYEGFPEMRSDPVGIANTSEALLQFYAEPPTNDQLLSFNQISQNPPQLVADPEYIHSTKAVYPYSLLTSPSESTSSKVEILKFIEDQLEKIFDFYKQEIIARDWTGYWNYGDFMHTYDSTRHQWLYDMGGYAWQNTELVPNLWLWYSFLRTGRSDYFRVAEAMSRHTSDVDVYHFGKYTGLGSRHNVLHWGCGCKEARIAMAQLNKLYYFLTCDERMGDVLLEVADADKAINSLDPMREFYSTEYGHESDGHKTHARVGPDWSAFVANWLHQWERTGDTKYRDYIKVGIKNILETPHRLLSGPTYGYDSETKELKYMGTGLAGGYHMVISFGAPQVWMEVAELLDDDDFRYMIAEFGAIYASTDEKKKEFSQDQFSEKDFSWPMFSTAMVAYAAKWKNDKDLEKRALENLLSQKNGGNEKGIQVKEIRSLKKLLEIENISTNWSAQWCLNAIVAMELLSNWED